MVSPVGSRYSCLIHDFADTHPLDHMMTQILGCMDKIRSFINRQNPTILDATLYVVVTFELIMGFKNAYGFRGSF